jgi:hypothetical protein
MRLDLAPPPRPGRLHADLREVRSVHNIDRNVHLKVTTSLPRRAILAVGHSLNGRGLARVLSVPSAGRMSTHARDNRIPEESAVYGHAFRLARYGAGFGAYVRSRTTICLIAWTFIGGRWSGLVGQVSTKGWLSIQRDTT